MEQQLQEISEKQKASWNQFSPGWKKWDADSKDGARAGSTGSALVQIATACPVFALAIPAPPIFLVQSTG